MKLLPFNPAFAEVVRQPPFAGRRGGGVKRSKLITAELVMAAAERARRRSKALYKAFVINGLKFISEVMLIAYRHKDIDRT